MYLDQEQANEVFLSTPSVGRATDIPIDVQIGVTTISIHALRGEGDAAATMSGMVIGFLSTPSVGRATLGPRWI